jgi:hypothetical protein
LPNSTRPQFVDAVDGGAIRQDRARIDRGILGLRIVGSPAADGVEILKRQAQRVDNAMALLAGDVVAMLLQPCANRLRLFARRL